MVCKFKDDRFLIDSTLIHLTRLTEDINPLKFVDMVQISMVLGSKATGLYVSALKSNRGSCKLRYIMIIQVTKTHLQQTNYLKRRWYVDIIDYIPRLERSIENDSGAKALKVPLLFTILRICSDAIESSLAHIFKGLKAWH